MNDNRCFKAIIVDDNVNTIKSLLVSIDWASLGIEVAGTAYDGIKGSELIRQVKPDIIITDINMPEMNGLNMIELVNSNEKNSKVIIITGYDKFQYARRAIKLSVFDYILKPIDDNELRLSLKRAKLSLENDINQNRMLEQAEVTNLKVRLLSYLAAPCSENAVPKPSAGENGGIVNQSGKPEDDECIFFIVIGQTPGGISRPLLERVAYEHFPANISVVSVTYEDYLVLFCTLKDKDPVWQKYAKNIASKLLSLSPDISIAVSGIHDSYRKSQAAFFEARKALLGQVFLPPTRKFVFYEKDKFSWYPSIAGSIDTLEKILVEDLNAETYDLLYDVLVKNAGGSMEVVRTLLMIFSLKILERKLKQSVWPESIDRLIYGILNINSVSEIRQWYTDYVDEINNLLNKESKQHKLVTDILNYIRLYASEGLSLKSAAERFNISPNYLSSLIHKETGKTYQHHVLESKMNIAKQMLNDTRLKIEEIGYSIGYENYVSFYKAFKSIERLTPSEYRFRGGD